MDVRILIVEGSDDQHVMWSLLSHHLPKAAEVFVCKPGDEPILGDPGKVKLEKNAGGGGDTMLLKSIAGRLVTSGLERLAVVIDADTKPDDARVRGPKARWDAIRQRLENEGYKSLPKQPDPEGTILELPSVEGRKPLRFGVWIMPDNQSEGMLESFVAQMIRKNDEMLPLVDEFLKSIREPRFSPAHRPKARIHSWLAIQKEPGGPMGRAITDKYLDTDRPLARSFLDWIDKALITDGERP